MANVISVVMSNRPVMKRKPDEGCYPQCNQYFGHIEVTHTVTPICPEYTPHPNGCKSRPNDNDRKIGAEKKNLSGKCILRSNPSQPLPEVRFQAGTDRDPTLEPQKRLVEIKPRGRAV